MGMDTLKFSFPLPISYFSRALWLSSYKLALANLVYWLGHICFHPGIVQQAQGCSAETAVSPHHNYQSTPQNLVFDKAVLLIFTEHTVRAVSHDT
jgi:hypothetical protein